jgi:hypothetical protein
MEGLGSARRQGRTVDDRASETHISDIADGGASRRHLGLGTEAGGSALGDECNLHLGEFFLELRLACRCQRRRLHEQKDNCLPQCRIKPLWFWGFRRIVYKPSCDPLKRELGS